MSSALSGSADQKKDEVMSDSSETLELPGKGQIESEDSDSDERGQRSSSANGPTTEEMMQVLAASGRRFVIGAPDGTVSTMGPKPRDNTLKSIEKANVEFMKTIHAKGMQKKARKGKKKMRAQQDEEPKSKQS